MVDPGERIRNRSPEEKQRQIVPRRNTISLRFYACTSYVLNLAVVRKPQMKKMCIIFWCVGITIINWVVQVGRTCASAKTDWPFNHFSVMSPMCTGCRAKNPVRCEEVVSLSYDRFPPTICISNTLKLHKKMCEIQLFQSLLSSVLKGLHGTIFYFTV